MTTTRTSRTARTCTTNTARTLTCGALLPAVALVLATAPAASASAPAAAGAALSCTLRVSSVEALDLRDDAQGTDEVTVRVGTQVIPESTYFLGQKRNTLGAATDTFSTTRRVRLVERGPGLLALQTAPIPCAVATRTVVLSDGDMRYRVIYNVQV